MNTTNAPQQYQPNPPQPDLHGHAQCHGPSQLHRLPPHSTEAEQAVLGCLLLDPAEGINLFIERIGHRPDAFYDIRHRTIFETILEMSRKGEPIDVVTLSNRLNNMNRLQSVGGQLYIAQLPDTAPAPASLYYYIDILRDYYLRRRLLQVCTAATEWSFDHSIDVPELLDRTEQQVFQVNSERLDIPQGIEKLAAKAVARAEFLFEHGGDPTGILTGFADFDRLTGGLHGGEMIVIAARPSVGKTALAMNIAEHVTMNSSLPTAVFSLEMSAESLVMRSLCARASVNLALLRDRIMTRDDLKRMRDAAEAVAKAPLYIDDTPGLSALELKARARRLRQRHRVALIIVDYLQLCH
ncbi:MAG: DnaB-like helicase C-terminal domain-containing protein, partial [Verrucomicrobiia bacterium]